MRLLAKLIFAASLVAGGCGADHNDGGGSAVNWHAMPDTLEFEIDGRRVRGAATFNVNWTGTGESAAGSFEITC